MDSIFAISTDSNCYPALTPLNGNKRLFGIAWYSEENHTTILKNLNINNQSLLPSLFALGTNGFICSENQIQPELNQLSNSPFRSTFGGRDWVIVCQVKMKEDYKQFLLIENNSFFKPLGTSDEEYIAGWIFDQIHFKNVSSLSDLRWSLLHSIFQKINDHGSVNVILSDGQDLIAFHDKNEELPFYGLQNLTPNITERFQLENFELKIGPINLIQSLVFFTSQVPLYDGHYFALLPNQMIVVRRGLFFWDSYANLIPPMPKTEHLQSVFPIKEETSQSNVSNTNPMILNQTYVLPLKTKAVDNASTQSPIFCISTSSPDKNPHVLSVIHDSYYKYSSEVYFSKHLFRLQPVHDVIQSLLSYKLSVSVRGKFCNFYGAFGNAATIFDITEPFADLHIHSEAIVNVLESPAQRYDLLHQRFTIPLIWMPWDRMMLQAYLSPPELSESELFELSDYAMSFVKRNNNDVIEVLNDINRTIHREYSYMSASTSLATTPFDVYEKRRGVCQDFANLFICLARLLNIPARYRVGYIYTGADYENKIQSEASHAWLEVYIPNVGWLGFDPTNGCAQTKNHIRVACGRYYQDATPTSGTIFKGGGIETLLTTVKVVRMNEIDPSVFQ